MQALSRARIRLALAFDRSALHSKAVGLYSTLLSQQPTAPVLWFAVSKSLRLSAGGPEHGPEIAALYAETAFATAKRLFHAGKRAEMPEARARSEGGVDYLMESPEESLGMREILERYGEWGRRERSASPLLSCAWARRSPVLT